MGTFVYALWECKLVKPFWEKVIEHMEKAKSMTIPKSPRLCLLGDHTELPQASKYDLTVIKVATTVHVDTTMLSVLCDCLLLPVFL